MSLVGDIARYAADLIASRLPDDVAPIAMIGIDIMDAAYRAAAGATDKGQAFEAAKAAMDAATAAAVVRRARGGP